MFCTSRWPSVLCPTAVQCRRAAQRRARSARVRVALRRICRLAAHARAAAALTSTTTAAPCPCRHRRSCRPAEHAATCQRTRGVQRARKHASERKTRAKGTHHHDHRRKRRAGHAAIERQQVAGARRAAGEASTGVSGRANMPCDKGASKRASERASERTRAHRWRWGAAGSGCRTRAAAPAQRQRSETRRQRMPHVQQTARLRRRRRASSSMSMYMSLPSYCHFQVPSPSSLQRSAGAGASARGKRCAGHALQRPRSSPRACKQAGCSQALRVRASSEQQWAHAHAQLGRLLQALRWHEHVIEEAKAHLRRRLLSTRARHAWRARCGSGRCSLHARAAAQAALRRTRKPRWSALLMRPVSTSPTNGQKKTCARVAAARERRPRRSAACAARP
jgi:hypothetical protein